MSIDKIDFRTQIAEELTRPELINRLCEYEEQVEQLRKELDFIKKNGISIVEIECPACNTKQIALEIFGTPYKSIVHECDNCHYIITESDWSRVENLL